MRNPSQLQRQLFIASAMTPRAASPTADSSQAEACVGEVVLARVRASPSK